MFGKSKEHPIKGYSYAVTTGTYVGEILVYVGGDQNNLKFISIPKNINREIPKDKFDFGMENKIVEIVEKLPSDVYSILKKQFVYNSEQTK
jgi:hypothetical protein